MCDSQFAEKLLTSFFEYRLQKVVVIRSVKFGLFYRSIQMSVIMYFLFYIVWHKKGYQVKEAPDGGVVFKVKGLDFVNRSEDVNYGARVWDSADYIVPPIMNGALFITTNARITDRQAMTVCSESPGSSSCSSDSDCPAGSIAEFGRRTGSCNSSSGSCEIFGWCPAPIADNVAPPAATVLSRAKNFTILIKNSVDFRELKKKRRNILDWMTSDYLKLCLHEANHPNLSFCPVFRLGDIIAGAGSNSDAIYEFGGAIGVDISWQCNFDLNDESCLPRYHFRELDTGHGTDMEGFSVQYAYNYHVDQQPRRMLVRAFGIKIFVTVSGEGGQFNLYCLSMNLGSGLALFGLSSMLCDVILLRIAGHKQRSSLQRARVVYCDDKDCDAAEKQRSSSSERHHCSRSARRSRPRRSSRQLVPLPSVLQARVPPIDILPLDASPGQLRAPVFAESSFFEASSEFRTSVSPSPGCAPPQKPRIVRRCYGNCPASPVARETLI